MKINGSCYCKRVTFMAISRTPYPYVRCYCSFCRKTAGSGGYGCNVMAQFDSLNIRGDEHLAYHHGFEHDPDTDALIENQNKRYFCQRCGSPLWAHDPRWAEWIYPFASAIDTPLPKPPEIVHIMLDFAAPWVEIPIGEGHHNFARYPGESILQWHQRQGLYDDAQGDEADK